MQQASCSVLSLAARSQAAACQDLPASNSEFCPVRSEENLNPRPADSRRPFAGGLRRRLAACALALLICALGRTGLASSIAWNASTDPLVTGYAFYSGPLSGDYTSRTDVGTNTTVALTGLTPGTTNYFAVTSYNVMGIESAFSAEVAYVAPVVNPAPVAALTSPANGAAYAAPASIPLTASVTANGHTITQVQYYNGATLLGQATAAPYALNWTGVGAGSYTLKAVAVYDSGSTVSSASAGVVVTNAAPTLPSIALTSPAGGASFTSPATIPLAASVTANGHAVTKVQFYNGAALLGESAAAPFAFTWSNVATGSYTLSAVLVYDAGSTVASASSVITVTSLPPPWQTANIGAPGLAGSASASGASFSVAGAGNLSGTADNFCFLYQPMSGDGEVRACLNADQGTNVNGRIGVMIRESLTSGSRYALMSFAPDDTFRWQRRSSTGGSTGSTKSATATPPNVWLRVVRTGNTFNGYRSTDGVTWTLVVSRNITMAANLYAGIAVASGATNTLNTATFTNVTVVP